MNDQPASVNTAIALIRPDGSETVQMRSIAVEAPVSLEFNGIAYAVMMATPQDLHDFALGFALAERLVSSPDEMIALDLFHAENGWIVRVSLAGALSELVFERARRRVAESSCGLCGIENLDAALRPLPAVDPTLPIEAEAVFRALQALSSHQPLNSDTGAVHAAAFAERDGNIAVVREDVGRHNALDKLVGALAHAGISARDGFIVVTSRCSYEIVEKAVLSGTATLVTISAPTSLAVERAKLAGLTLIVLARHDSAWRIESRLGKMDSTEL